MTTPACVDAREEPGAGSPSPPPAWREINNLLNMAFEYLGKDRPHQAELALRKALHLEKKSSKIDDYNVVAPLSTSLEKQGKWAEDIKLMETIGLQVWPNVDRAIAYDLMQLGRHAEARILYSGVLANEKPPTPGGFCGTPYADYQRLQDEYATCVEKTKDLTAEELKRVEDNWRSEENELRRSEPDKRSPKNRTNPGNGNTHSP